MDKWAIVRQIIAIILALLSGRNGQVVSNPFTDWQVLLPAAGAVGAVGWNGFSDWFKQAGARNVLKLVEQIIPFQEQVVPRELMNVLLDVMAWRFKNNAEAVKLVDQLVQYDMQMSRVPPSTTQAHDDTTRQLAELQAALAALTGKLDAKPA